ncbi:hypothetical protein Tco_1202874 [Tanacetum coccineum]
MAALQFASSHNMVAFLDKPTESDGFEQIVDFLNTHPIKYALTIQALVDKKKVIITETSVRSDLQLKDVEELVTNDTENVASVHTHSNDPLLSGEDRLKLNELMELCASLSQRVLDLENTKISQATEITELKKREDASKQGRKIADIDADVEVTLVDETQGRIEEEMFDTGILDGEEVFAEQGVVEKEVTTASTTTTTVDELTLAQTLIEIKAAKPKARGVVVQDPREFTTTTSPS